MGAPRHGVASVEPDAAARSRLGRPRQTRRRHSLTERETMVSSEECRDANITAESYRKVVDRRAAARSHRIGARPARAQSDTKRERRQRRNRSYGAYGGPRKAGLHGVACARTRLRTIPTSVTSSAAPAASGASLYNRRRLAEFPHL